MEVYYSLYMFLSPCYMTSEHKLRNLTVLEANREAVTPTPLVGGSY